VLYKCMHVYGGREVGSRMLKASKREFTNNLNGTWHRIAVTSKAAKATQVAIMALWH